MTHKYTIRVIFPLVLATVGAVAVVSPPSGGAIVPRDTRSSAQIVSFTDQALASNRPAVRHAYGSGSPVETFSSDGYVQPGSSFIYTEFGGTTETVVPWVGDNVAVLVPKSESSSLSAKTMTEVIDALDSSWSEYEFVTGQSPALDYSYDGRDSVAVVKTDSACAGDAACSYLGVTGTEIFNSYFETLYNGVAINNQYDQALFYEFGRNFWFYGPSLAGDEDPGTTYGSTVTTGFAVLMRFRTMDATGIPGGPFSGTPFPTFEAQDWALVYDYDSDLSDTFANTLAVGASPGIYGGTDFFASILNLLSRYGGECFLKRFFAAASSEPAAVTDDEAVTNFVNATSQAAEVDLGPFFYTYWGFPKANGTSQPRKASGIAHLPRLASNPTC